jgi:hypothetical protein
VTSKESGVNAGHHRAKAWWVRGELKGVIATNVEGRDAIDQALHWEKKKRTARSCRGMRRVVPLVGAN